MHLSVTYKLVTKLRSIDHNSSECEELIRDLLEVERLENIQALKFNPNLKDIKINTDNIFTITPPALCNSIEIKELNENKPLRPTVYNIVYDEPLRVRFSSDSFNIIKFKRNDMTIGELIHYQFPENLNSLVNKIKNENKTIANDVGNLDFFTEKENKMFKDEKVFERTYPYIDNIRYEIVDNVLNINILDYDKLALALATVKLVLRNSNDLHNICYEISDVISESIMTFDLTGLDVQNGFVFYIEANDVVISDYYRVSYDNLDYAIKKYNYLLSEYKKSLINFLEYKHQEIDVKKIETRFPDTIVEKDFSLSEYVLMLIQNIYNDQSININRNDLIFNILKHFMGYYNLESTAIKYGITDYDDITGIFKFKLHKRLIMFTEININRGEYSPTKNFYELPLDNEINEINTKGSDAVIYILTDQRTLNITNLIYINNIKNEKCILNYYHR